MTWKKSKILQIMFFLYFSSEEIIGSIHQRLKTSNTIKKFSDPAFLQIKNYQNPFTDGEIPFTQNSDQKLSRIVPNCTDTFFPKNVNILSNFLSHAIFLFLDGFS